MDIKEMDNRAKATHRNHNCLHFLNFFKDFLTFLVFPIYITYNKYKERLANHPLFQWLLVAIDKT